MLQWIQNNQYLRTIECFYDWSFLVLIYEVYILVEYFNLVQKAALTLIQQDLRYIYTVIKNIQPTESNYIPSMIPYLQLLKKTEYKEVIIEDLKLASLSKSDKKLLDIFVE